MNMNPIQPTRISIPCTEWEFQLTAQDKKVMAVALTSLALFAFQLSFSWTISLSLTAALTVITLLFDRNDNDWFNWNFEHQTIIAYVVSLLILRPFILQVICWALGIPLSPIPYQEGVAKLILEQPWKMIPIVTLVDPISEEILFRGFLLERLEDLGFSENISDWLQAVLFSAAHIPLMQGGIQGMEILVFVLISLTGWALSRYKREGKSLIAPMAVHSAVNIGACEYIYLSSRV